MNHCMEYRYLQFNGENFFTIILLPEKHGKFPVVVYRSPYVKRTTDMLEDYIMEECYEDHKNWLERGYAVVFQHCRGQGKSTGAFVPYVQEREDGLALRLWIRTQPFYNGEIYLVGGSYTASLHYATAPFEEDVKGAVLEVQDSERYRLWYRNGQMRKGHANWHFGLYKEKCHLDKNFNIKSFSKLPLCGLSKDVLGEYAEDFEEMLKSPFPTDEFWTTRFGGIDTKDSIINANIPILLTTGYNDYYIGGVFDMWKKMKEQTKRKSALLVSPYNHGDGYNSDNGICFLNGKRSEAFGRDYAIDWIDNIRYNKPIPYKKGVVTYYRTFEDRWEGDFYKTPTKILTLNLCQGERSFIYDPSDPPCFRESGLIREDLGLRKDVVSLCTAPFVDNVFVKGQMKMRLSVESDCQDTAFYVRISIKKEDFTYILCHDITSIGYQLGNYEPNTMVLLELVFDEYAFLIKKGESLQIDISSADDNSYIAHTNRKGAYWSQAQSQTACNKIYTDKSCLILPVE